MFRLFGYDYDKTSFSIAILFLLFSMPCFLFAYNFYFKSAFLFVLTLSHGIICLIGAFCFFKLLIEFRYINNYRKNNCKNKKDKNHCNQMMEVSSK